MYTEYDFQNDVKVGNLQKIILVRNKNHDGPALLI